MNNSIEPYKFSLLAVTFITLLSACGGGSDNSSPIKKVENKRPTVLITGAPDVESGTEVRLTSNASDPDGSIASYQWSQKSGEMVFMRDKDQANTTFTAPVVDTDTTLEFELVVTDNKGAKATDTVSVKVKGAVQVSSYYDSCNESLALNVFKVRNETLSFWSLHALKGWFCSAPKFNNAEFAQQVMTTLSLEGNEQDVEQWKTTHCSDGDRAFGSSKSAHELLQSAEKDAVANWSSCIAQQQALSCYMIRDSKLEFGERYLKYGFKPGSSRLVNADIVATNLSTVTALPTTLENNGTDIVIKQQDVLSEASFELSGMLDNDNVSCTYTKQPIHSHGAELCEVQRLRALEQGKISEREYIALKETDDVPLLDGTERLLKCDL